MDWIICAIIAILLIALSLKTYLTKKWGTLRVLWVLVFLFVATYVIYLPGFLRSYDVASALFGGIIHVVQVISIDADFLQFYDLIKSAITIEVLSSGYMAILVILHLALPIVSLSSAFTLLLRCISTVKLYFANKSKKPLFIFSEVNDRALKLASDLSKIKCDIVFAGCDYSILSGKNDNVKDYIFKEEKIDELKIKNTKNKNVYFMCLSIDEDKSLSNSLTLIDKYSTLKEDEQEYIHIYQFSKYKDYSVYIDSTNKGSLDIRCINEYEMLIYNLLDKYPLYKYAKQDMHVLLYGLSPINVTAFKAISWCGQIYNRKLKISVVGKDIEGKIDELKISVPGLLDNIHHVDFYSTKTESQALSVVKEKCSDANYILVSEETDNLTMEKGVELRRLFYKVDNTFTNCPPIFCYVQDDAKFNVLKNLKTAGMNYDLIPFGSIDEIYTLKYLIDSSLEKIAKNVHLAYEEFFATEPINVKKAIKRYNVFEVNKRSNWANALHIRYKLNLLGLDYTEDETLESVDFKEYLTDELLQKLAISEHDRWLSFLQSEGWNTSSREDVYAYRESGISKGRHNCPILKLHPYICEFDKLRDLSMEVEGKDTSLYDSELIIRIPDILGDKWGNANKKFNIIKLK